LNGRTRCFGWNPLGSTRAEPKSESGLSGSSWNPGKSLQLEVEEITEAADARVLSGALATARGKGSGVETRLRFWYVAWFANGKVTRRRVFRDRAEALEAAGLSE
jgi:hypothetical protein